MKLTRNLVLINAIGYAYEQSVGSGILMSCSDDLCKADYQRLIIHERELLETLYTELCEILTREERDNIYWPI